MVDIEDVVKLAVYKCREVAQPVTETLAAYVAHTIKNPDTNKFYIEGKLSEKEAADLSNKTVEKLLAVSNPQMETMKMQMNYDSTYVQQEYLKQHYKAAQDYETNRLIDDIINCETRGGNDFEGITLLYKKIFNFLLFKNKQVGTNYAGVILRPGNVNNLTNLVLNPDMSYTILNTVEREVAAALESVLPRAGLRPFVALSSPEKASQLLELANIVIGIRLFNKEIGKGGVGLDSFDDLVNHNARGLLKNLSDEASEVIETLEGYNNFFSVDVSDPNITPDQLQTWQFELTHKRQYLSYLIAIQEDMQVSEQNIENYHSKFIREMVELKELIGNKTSIPKDQVYPKFDNLCQIYMQMNEERNFALMRRGLFNLLVEQRDKVNNTLPTNLSEIARTLVGSMTVNADLLEDSLVASGVERLTETNTPDFMHLPLDYQGFCIWTVAKRNGLLLPGKPNLGVVRYKDMHFVFASVQAVSEFMANPEEVVNQVLEEARDYPEIIHLIRMTEEFPEASLSHILQGKEGQPMFSLSAPLMVDTEAQTELHPVLANIDRQYRWNEWDLRREALQKANIRKRITTSSQTIASNFRRENESQVWLPKDNDTNTGKSVGTDMERPLVYNVGLRQRNN